MFSDRLKQLRNKKNIPQAELADMLGLTQQAIGRWEKNKATPDYDTLKKLSTFFNVSTDYLLGNSDFPLSNEIPLPVENKKIPVIGTVTCGPGGLAYQYIDDYVYIDSSLSGDIRALHCKGDSMAGMGIFEGDTAIIRIQDTIENGELAVIVINGDEGTLKRVRLQENVIVLEASNPAYPPRIFAGKEMKLVKIVGKVIEIRRKF
ncbi:MAG: LexA family transcriptional regulator [Selenomonadaceae bacterium]